MLKSQFWMPLTLVLLAMPGTAERASFLSSQPVMVALDDEAAELFDELVADAKTAQKVWIDEYRAKADAAKEAGEDRPSLDWTESPIAEFIPEFEGAAENYAGTEDAVQFLLWIVTNASRINPESTKGALTTLCTTHVSSKGLEPLGRSLGRLSSMVGEELAAELLANIEQRSSLPALVGQAAFTRLTGVLESNGVETKAFKNAKADLLAAVKKADDSRLQSRAEQKIRLYEAFGIGMVAPDIDGIDLDGTAFKLSDYKGKILFVDFWGDW